MREIDAQKCKQNMEEGIARSAASAGPKFSDEAVEYFKHYPDPDDKGFKTEDVRGWAYENGLRPSPSGNELCWGSIARRARKLEYIRIVGLDTTKNPNCHQSVVKKYLKC
jgi:hypothetical protein